MGKSWGKAVSKVKIKLGLLDGSCNITFQIWYFDPMPGYHEIQIIGIIQQGTNLDYDTNLNFRTSNLYKF